MSPATAKKRIYNPVTQKYYEIRQHSSKYRGGRPDQGVVEFQKEKQMIFYR